MRRRQRFGLGLGLGLGLAFGTAAACAADEGAGRAGDDYVPPDPPAEGREDGGAAAVPADECLASGACPTGVCAAGFMGTRRSGFVCVESCVAVGDASRWCAADAACCGSARCGPRGMCAPEPEGESTGEDGGEGSTGESTTTG